MTYSVKAYYLHKHGDDPVVVTTAEEMDALIDALLGERLEHNSVVTLYVQERPHLPSGFPDHELRIAINSETKVGGLRYAGAVGHANGVWYASGQRSDRDEVWYCYMGHDEDFPRDSEIPIDGIRSTAKDFLATGGDRPASVHWKEWPQHIA